MSYDDYDYMDAVIFPDREEKSYEDCDTRVDMSWADHHEETEGSESYEWCILQKTLITNPLKETKTYSYCPYEIFSGQAITLNDLQLKVEELNRSLKEEPYKYRHKMCNGCSVKVLSFVWAIVNGRVNSGMVEIGLDGNHCNPLESDISSVNMLFSTSGSWVKFGTKMTDKWKIHKIAGEDFTRGLFYNPLTDQTATYIDWEQ